LVDAGMSGTPAFCEKSVSPRVSDTTIIPNCPFLTRPACEARSAESDATVRGDV